MPYCMAGPAWEGAGAKERVKELFKNSPLLFSFRGAIMCAYMRKMPHVNQFG